jgi:hypothetical protein
MGLCWFNVCQKGAKGERLVRQELKQLGHETLRQAPLPLSEQLPTMDSHSRQELCTSSPDLDLRHAPPAGVQSNANRQRIQQIKDGNRTAPS